MTTTTPARRSVATVVRFDAVQRTAHWVNAAFFTVLILTAIPLYFGTFFGVVFPRHDVQMIHLWTGLALPVPVIVSLCGPWGRRMREDLGRVNVWTRDEIAWLRTLGRTPLRTDKFNPGQKANVIFTGASIVVLLVTGYMLQWFRFFPVTWRSGATFTHDLFALAVVVVIAGHIVFALTHPASLRSMFTGEVDETWVARHAPAWRDDQAVLGRRESASSDARREVTR